MGILLGEDDIYLIDSDDLNKAAASFSSLHCKLVLGNKQLSSLKDNTTAINQSSNFHSYILIKMDLNGQALDVPTVS